MKTKTILLFAAGALALLGLKNTGATSGDSSGTSSCHAGMNCVEIVDRTKDPIEIISCAQNGYFYVKDASGHEIGKVDIPKGGCRRDSIPRSYMPSGWYDFKITDYSGIVKSESWELL